VTHDAREKSSYGGEPVECFLLSSGPQEWRYTSDASFAECPGAGGFDPYPISRSDFRFSEEYESGSLEITLPRDSTLAALFIPYAPAEPVSIRVYRFHRGEAESVLAFTGKVSSATARDARLVLICLPLSGLLKRLVPRFYYQRQCNWSLYSTQCGVDAASYKTTAVLSYLEGNEITSSAFAAKSDGWFVGGYVQSSDGQRRLVTGHSGEVLTLLRPFFGIVAGATVDAYAGCDKAETTCRDKFNNVLNHLGFPRIPLRNPYTSGII